MRRRMLIGLILGLCGWMGWVRAEIAAPAVEPRHERVAMRDGTRLATDVWLPAGSGPWPVAMARTPYDKNGIKGDRFVASGMALVVQDVRGRFASEGKAQP